MDEYTIQLVKEAADIVDVVGDFLELRKTGTRYTAVCPFHDDRHDGNFIVYPKGNCYRCFACDAKGGTVEFLMAYGKMSFPDAIRWLGKKYSIDVDDVNPSCTPPPLRPTPPPLPMLALPADMVIARQDTTKDTLCRWLYTLPWDSSQKARLPKILGEYSIGHARTGHTIFWQIDADGIVRTGKMMKYREDGHRDREARYSFDWIHSALYRDARLPQWSDELYECKPTLFGMHLLRRYPQASVNIVESEKTAVIMATAYGNSCTQIWMACSGAENLSEEKLAPIINERRRIILYPDRDAIDKWRAKAHNLRYDRISVNVQAVKDWWQPCDGPKADIADVILRMICSHSIPAVTVGDIMRQDDRVKSLVEKLNMNDR